MKAQLSLKLMTNNYTNRGGIIDIMTSELEIFKNDKLVSIINVEGEEAYKQLSIILLRDKICGIKSDVSYYYDENGYLVIILTLKIKDYIYRYEFKGLDTVI